MLRVACWFDVFGAAMWRFYSNLDKYKPKDVYIEHLHDASKKLEGEYDLFITHCGVFGQYPYLAFISPKVVLSEQVNEVTLSHFKDKDLLLTYNPEWYDYAKERGVNVLLWPRPVDPDIFYPEPTEKKYMLLSPQVHDIDQVTIANNIVNELGGKHFICHRERIDGVIADYGFASARTENDKMRSFYCSSLYSMSVYNACEVYAGMYGMGYENSTVEAAFCGCRPITMVHTKCQSNAYWWGAFAKIIRQEHFEEDLYNILSESYAPMSDAAIQLAFDRFNARKVLGEFWDAVRNIL